MYTLRLNVIGQFSFIYLVAWCSFCKVNVHLHSHAVKLAKNYKWTVVEIVCQTKYSINVKFISHCGTELTHLNQMMTH